MSRDEWRKWLPLLVAFGVALFYLPSAVAHEAAQQEARNIVITES